MYKAKLMAGYILPKVIVQQLVSTEDTGKL